jgi:hypothetical protein
MSEWYGNYSVATGSATTGYLTTSGAYSLPVTYSTGLPAAVTPPPSSPFAWLDDEVEKTCALAR